MITDQDAIAILYKYVQASELMQGNFKPSGGLYKLQRPFGSDKEDYVINSLPFSLEQLQEGVLNFNIHVPSLGTGDEAQPNTPRLAVLSRKACEILAEVWSKDGQYMFRVQQVKTYQDTDRSWYSNIRVEFRNVNV